MEIPDEEVNSERDENTLNTIREYLEEVPKNAEEFAEGMNRLNEGFEGISKI